MPLTSNASSQRGLTAELINGRATGALFFLGFGAVWAFLGLAGLHRATVPALLLLLAVTLALLAAVLWLWRRAKTLPAGTLSPEAEERMKRMFTAVNIIQWVSVFTAVAILNVLHRPEYIAAVITVIVGLHLFPLATSFRYPQHHVTGALLVLWAAGCMAAVQPQRLAGVCSLGTGLILLASALSTVLRCLWQLRGAAGSLPSSIAAA